MKDMTPIKGVVVHHSDSRFGNVGIIREWHKERGFEDIGYHFVITNGIMEPRGKYSKLWDGFIHAGRSLKFKGAHTAGYNDMIGVCFIGAKYMPITPRQNDSLFNFVNLLLSEYGLMENNLYGHRDLSDTECPGFDVKEWYRDRLKKQI